MCMCMCACAWEVTEVRMYKGVWAEGVYVCVYVCVCVCVLSKGVCDVREQRSQAWNKGQDEEDKGVR